MRTFRVLRTVEIQKLSIEEKILYYQQLKEYYMTLPYDYEKMEKLEKNYTQTVNNFLPLVNLLCKPTIINQDLIPEGNGLIFTSNHLGTYDQFPIISAIGNRPIHFIMKDTLFTAKEFYRGYLFEKLGAIPVDITTPEGKRRAQEVMVQAMLHGSNTLYFPEGSRGTKKEHSDKNLPLDFQRGAVVNAQITSSTIIPISINNDYKLFRKNYIIVRINEPLTVSVSDNVDDALAELRNRIVNGIRQNQKDGYKIKRKDKSNKWIYYNV